MHIDLFEPFIKGPNRRRPLLGYGVLVVLVIVTPLLWSTYGDIAVIFFFAFFIAWSYFCKHRKWM